MKRFFEKIEKSLVASTFAEANTHQIAREYLGVDTKPVNAGYQLQEFLKDIGLQHVPVRYGIARF